MTPSASWVKCAFSTVTCWKSSANIIAKPMPLAGFVIICLSSWANRSWHLQTNRVNRWKFIQLYSLPREQSIDEIWTEFPRKISANAGSGVAEIRLKNTLLQNEINNLSQSPVIVLQRFNYVLNGYYELVVAARTEAENLDALSEVGNIVRGWDLKLERFFNELFECYFPTPHTLAGYPLLSCWLGGNEKGTGLCGGINGMGYCWIGTGMGRFLLKLTTGYL